MIRIPVELIDRVRTLADRKQSTVPKQVVYLLEKALMSEDIEDIMFPPPPKCVKCEDYHFLNDPAYKDCQ